MISALVMTKMCNRVWGLPLQVRKENPSNTIQLIQFIRLSLYFSFLFPFAETTFAFQRALLLCRMREREREKLSFVLFSLSHSVVSLSLLELELSHHQPHPSWMDRRPTQSSDNSAARGKDVQEFYVHQNRIKWKFSSRWIYLEWSCHNIRKAGFFCMLIHVTRVDRLTGPYRLAATRAMKNNVGSWI